MALVKNYKQFAGLHYETGTVRNILAHQGAKAPHTGKPLSEAMLLGISGGVAFGYFLFDYKGFPPMLSLLSRNTFDPLETLLTRLGAPRDVRQTTSADKAQANLLDALEGGQPVIAWADMFSLPYNALSRDEHWWAMLPLVVFGVDDGCVHIADRSRRPLTVSVEQFNLAWARVKKDQYRLMTLHAPDLTRLRDAVHKGIWQCVQLYTEKPPKGAKTNFGFAAMRHWAAMLTNTRNVQSWARFFPPGPRLWSALTGANGVTPGLIGATHTSGFGDGMERGAYADFLDEAANLLDRPKLRTAAGHFRASREVWLELARVALPDDAPLCREARELTLRRHALFVEQGGDALDEIQAVNARLGEIRAAVGAAAGDAFPLSDGQVTAMQEQMSALVMRIHDIESEAIKVMQAAMN